jgi:hypothetical protein
MKRTLLAFFGGCVLGVILTLLIGAGIVLGTDWFCDHCAAGEGYYPQTATAIQLTNNWVITQIANTQTATFEMQTIAP